MSRDPQHQRQRLGRLLGSPWRLQGMITPKSARARPSASAVQRGSGQGAGFGGSSRPDPGHPRPLARWTPVAEALSVEGVAAGSTKPGTPQPILPEPRASTARCGMPYPSLGEDVAQVYLDGVVAEEQACGDLTVRQPFCDKCRDLEFVRSVPRRARPSFSFKFPQYRSGLSRAAPHSPVGRGFGSGSRALSWRTSAPWLTRMPMTHSNRSSEASSGR